MSNSTNTSNTKNNSWLEIFAIITAIVIVFFIWLFYPTFVQNRDKPIQPNPPSIIIPYKQLQPVEVSKQETEFQKFGDTYGTYGDSYGSLNTLFSGLAFAILIISLLMQRQELQAQRQELEAQRNEITKSNTIAEGQRKITEQQAQLIKQQIKDTNIQNFYNTLFKFLKEKERKISLLATTRTSEIRGEYIFQKFIASFKNSMVAIFPTIAYFDTTDDDAIFSRIDTSFSLAKLNSKGTINDNQIYEYIVFILNYIEKNNDLGITEDSINIFISYQTLDEMYCMFLYGQFDNKLLLNYINKYSLLRKFYTLEDEYLAAIFYKLADKKSYEQ